MASSSSLFRFFHNRWLVLVGACWAETCTGLNVLYATFSPAIKSSLGYNQKQISRLGVAKDFGNAAEIIAGFLSQVISPRGLLILGALQFLLGYGLLWLIVVGEVPAPPFWTVFVLVFIGANAQKYVDMAAVVSCLPSFPDSRGSLLGVLKAFKGLSGAMYSQIYSTFFSPLRSAALLEVAVGPALVALTMSFIVRPVGNIPAEDKRSETITYRILYVLCLLITAYMVIVLIFEDDLPAGDYRLILLFSGLMLLTLMPLSAPIYSVFVLNKGKSDSKIEIDLEGPLLEAGYRASVNHGSDEQKSSPAEVNGKPAIDDERNEQKPAISDTEEPVPGGLKRFWSSRGREEGHRTALVGEEVPFCQALRTLEFWLLFLALYCGLGSGSTALDNLAQMAEAQGYDKTQTFVSIFSISSYVGHLAGGHMSDVLVSKCGLPRAATLIGIEGCMMVAQFFFAMAWPGAIYIASICLGFSYGSFSSVNPAVSSELFGLKSFGPIFGLLTLSAPASSTVLAGFVAGTIYDREAAKQGSSDCSGQVCFYVTCWILVGVCGAGMLFSTALSWRTRNLKLGESPKHGENPHPKPRHSRVSSY